MVLRNGVKTASESYVRSLIISAVFLLLALVFFSVASSVEATPSQFDRSVANLLEGDVSEKPTFTRSFWTNVTSLGSGPLVLLLVLIVLGYLLLARHPKTALVVFACVSLAAFSAFALKAVFERPRPMELSTLLGVDGYSFPSGHSVISGAVYPVLAALVARVVQGPRLKAYCFGTGVLLMLLIGTSRIYLGVHHATDVLAGWTVGLAWALFGWVVLSRLQESGVVEDEPIAEEIDGGQ
jgi:undecaprenyl-diphosphatase